ncbi:T9SS type A sorting domain-containing protein [Adhaeribacter soli]|uniref:T9SS type A sorting domain-containing protein n=1 Tax=Adhaeribacter soli TaxID=2607655 RepID=A0A5N1IN23_9BACT|nr:T9SS type A sorting domain-containing protein [Adhaeribacter soli]KAA9325191.1 T9SS type A sorting domain-containing protein [Adhaeribacter soli]
MKKITLILIVFFSAQNHFVFAQWTKLAGLSQNVNSIFKSNNNLIVGTNFGISYSSNNGKNWNNSLGISTIAKSFAKDGNTLLVASYEKLYKSNDDGATWASLSTIYTNQAANNVVISNAYYVVGMNGRGIWYSNTSGNSWLDASSSWISKNTDIAVKKNLLFAAYQGSGYFQSSNNDGVTWSSPSGNGIKIGSSWQDIYSLSIKNDSIIIAGTKNGGSFSSYDGVYFSYDNGNNWTKQVNGLTNTSINSTFVVGNLIFAGTNGGGVFYSVNDGNNWNSLNNGLTDLTINKLYAYGDTLYAGVGTGLFKIGICELLKNTSTLTAIGSTIINKGDSIKLTTNLAGSNYKWLKNDSTISGANSNTYFAKASGSYKVVISYSTSCKDTTNIITINYITGINKINESSFFQIFPNPTTGEGIINCKLPQNENQGQLIIYNSKGQVVKQIAIDGKTEKLKFCISDLLVGTYYYRFLTPTGKTTLSNKLIIIK